MSFFDGLWTSKGKTALRACSYRDFGKTIRHPHRMDFWKWFILCVGEIRWRVGCVHKEATIFQQLGEIAHSKIAGRSLLPTQCEVHPDLRIHI